MRWMALWRGGPRPGIEYCVVWTKSGFWRNNDFDGLGRTFCAVIITRENTEETVLQKINRQKSPERHQNQDTILETFAFGALQLNWFVTLFSTSHTKRLVSRTARAASQSWNGSSSKCLSRRRHKARPWSAREFWNNPFFREPVITRRAPYLSYKPTIEHSTLALSETSIILFGCIGDTRWIFSKFVFPRVMKLWRLSSPYLAISICERSHKSLTITFVEVEMLSSAFFSFVTSRPSSYGTGS